MNRAAVARKKPPKKNNFSTRLVRQLTPGRIIIGGSLLSVLLIFGVLVVNSMVNQVPSIDYSVPDSSVVIATLESPHVQHGEQHPPYNSNPPTSGPHFAQPANWGSYREGLADETLVHNLEHGGIWISYRDNDEAMIQQLEDIARRYSSHVILTYRPTNDSPIAVAAWGRLLKLDTVDSGQIYNFIARYRFKGPENV